MHGMICKKRYKTHVLFLKHYYLVIIDPLCGIFISPKEKCFLRPDIQTKNIKHVTFGFRALGRVGTQKTGWLEGLKQFDLLKIILSI